MNRLAAVIPVWAAVVVVVGVLGGGGVSIAHAADAAQLDFFESKIRPLLVKHCYECHSGANSALKGSLRIDTKDGVLKGGKSGPAVAPGNADVSLLIKAVKHSDPSGRQMPKGKPKLSDAEIADLEQWIKMGVPDPRTGGAGGPPEESAMSKARRHWSFQPVKEPPVPDVGQPGGWCKSPVDAFILAELQKQGLTPSPPAERRELIRRATYDLHGLPPTPEEVDAFVKDDSPDALAKLVDRLLASPRYGERWGRHWLDLARYSDTKGYVGGDGERRYFFAWTYRDWVIRSVNEDLPYDQFLLQQIAADLLPKGADNRSLAALGFLTVGKRNLGNAQDIIDDRIDVVTRGLMGLTVACARCHDHKTEPVPTRDYYSLYGVFASTKEPEQLDQLPVLDGARANPDFAKYQAEFDRIKSESETFKADLDRAVRSKVRGQVAVYVEAAYEGEAQADQNQRQKAVVEKGLDRQLFDRWFNLFRAVYSHFKEKREHNPVFAVWAELREVPAAEFAARAAALEERLRTKPDPAKSVNAIVREQVLRPTPASFAEVVERYGKLLREAQLKYDAAKRQEPAPLPEPDWEAIRQVMVAKDAPFELRENDLERFYDDPAKERLRQFKHDRTDLLINHPGSPARALALVDSEKPAKAEVFLKGDNGNRGEEVPRQFLEVLAGDGRKPFPDNTSGRLQVAQAIAPRDNPLTARVFVNRVWMHHFGQPLVPTVSDFGVGTGPASHPQLLDWLAYRFMQEGWSLKKLHRLMMLSAVYRQSSRDAGRGPEVDPSNRWYWKMSRRRVDFESLRDSLLAAAGRLDVTLGGPPVDLLETPFSGRRTVYGFVDRLDFPEVFRSFDVPNPDKTIAQRPQTTVPQQALFMMNGEFLIEQARHLAGREDVKAAPSDQDRVKLLFRHAYQREPLPQEVELGVRFVQSRPETAAAESQPTTQPSTDSPWQYGHGVYDASTRRVKEFQPMTQFAGDAWQPAGAAAEDASLRGLRLSANGGQTGERAAVIRRWTSPRDGNVRVSGVLSRVGNAGGGGGAVARVVSSGSGELAAWHLGAGATDANLSRVSIRKGETIDFVVEPVDGGGATAFKWSARVRVIDANTALGSTKHTWDTAADFVTPARPLNVWDRYAQVLLMSNEFAYDN